MKKSITVLSVIAVALSLLAIILVPSFAGVLKFYDGGVIGQAFGGLLGMFAVGSFNLGQIVFFSVAGLSIFLLVLQIVLLIVNRHPKALFITACWFLVSFTTILFCVALFSTGFFKDITDTPTKETVVDSSGFIAYVWRLMQTGYLNHGQTALAFIAPALILIAFVCALIAEIQDLVLIGQEPGTPKRDYSSDLDSGDKVVVVHEDTSAVAPSSEEIRSMLRDELAGQTQANPNPNPFNPAHPSEPSAAAEYRDNGSHAYNAPMAPLPPANQTPIINGPLLVQYINTYSPSAPATQSMPAPVEAKPAPQPSVPLKEVQGVVSNAEKPLSADEIKRIIKEELAEAKPEAKPASPAPVAPLTKEDVAAIVSAELKEALKPAEKPVEAKPEEPKPEEVKPEVKPIPEAPKEEEPAVVVEPVAATSLSAEELRLLIAEELTAAKDHDAREKKEEPASPKNDEPSVRDVIKEELAAYRAQEENEKQTQSASVLTSDEIRKIIAEEFDKKAQPAESKPAEPSLTAEQIREVIKEELAALLKDKEAAPAPAPVESKPAVSPAPVVVVVHQDSKAPVEVIPAKEEEAPKRVVGAINPNLPPHPKIIRIPFPTRMLSSDKALQSNYNELKSDIMAYGVKSRVSNSGDTFRLHKVTYLKITIAGKSLKLYYALNPKDYANTTLPISDAGHKSIYKEIPLVFKVKSDLSLRRAKQLIADALAKGKLEQGKVEPHNWAQDLVDYKDQGEGSDDD